jgi:RIP metalloprotease RseP
MVPDGKLIFYSYFFYLMSILLGILLTVIVLLIVVMIHEFGHFITARMTGMRVDEFGVGIPPRARTLYQDSRGTEYTLNWLPIGGFVRIYGENHTDHGATHARDSFMHKKWPSRVLVLSAGVIMNFVLAYLIFVGLFVTGVSPVTVLPQTPHYEWDTGDSSEWWDRRSSRGTERESPPLYLREGTIDYG